MNSAALMTSVFVWVFGMALFFRGPNIIRWFRKKSRIRKIRKEVVKVLVEETACSEAYSFALAASSIDSADIFDAAYYHPNLQKRFNGRGRRRIAEVAIILRKDEHEELERDRKWRDVVYTHNNRFRRRMSWEREPVGYISQPPPEPRAMTDATILNRLLEEVAELARLASRVQETENPKKDHLKVLKKPLDTKPEPG